MKKSDNQSPKKGMNRHTHPSELSDNEYSFAINANIQDVAGDGDLILTNEPSNISCSNFKDGYIVLKHKYDRVSNKIYFFLVNEETGCSEIGYILATEDFDINQVEELICNCNTFAELETPLEDILQEPRCEYVTIFSDYCTETRSCNGCLNFSRKHPILSVEIRHSILGDELYWNDGYNPDRYLKLYDLDSYFKEVDDCTGEVTNICLDCDRLRIFNLFNTPCIEVVSVEGGGSLPQSVISVFVAYCEMDGTELSDYFTPTNPISIFDENRRTIEQTQLATITNKSIRIQINEPDLSFDYYRVVLAVRTGLDVEYFYKNYGVFPTSQKDVYITQLPTVEESNSANSLSNAFLSVNELLNKKPFYKSSEIMSNANGYLYLGKLKSQREVNLQPVVNLMGAFVKWGTGVAKENLYTFGEANANYKGYMRNESYALSIRFNFNGGYSTALFPFIARPSFDTEVLDIDVDDKNKLSIDYWSMSCEEGERNKVWQYLNTAEDLGEILCDENPSGDGEPFDKEITYSCDTETDITISSGSISSIDIEGSLISYINSHRDEIITSSNPELSDIKTALTSLVSYGNCTPSVGDTCDSPVLDSEYVIAVSTTGEEKGDISEPYDSYDPVFPPSENSNLVEPNVHDTVIEGIIGGAATVWEKAPVSNTSCSLAPVVMDFSGGSGTGYHLIDMGTTGSSSGLYNTSIPVSLTDNDFHPYLHNNAVWFRVIGDSSERIVAQLSEVVCGLTDDNTNNKVRVTFFSGCPSITEVPSYGIIINDLTVVSSDLFFDLDASDFSGTTPTVYIAIDSPMNSEFIVDAQLSGTSGNGKFVVYGVDYTLAFNSNLSTTASDFVSTHSASLLLEGIVVSNVGSKITFTYNRIDFDIPVWVNLASDLSASVSLISQKHLLQPPCGSFAIYERQPQLLVATSWDTIKFVKRQFYTYTCTFYDFEIKDCGVYPYREGYFSYTESGLKYPCNPELFNSSTLIVDKDRIPLEYQSDFEDFYVDADTGQSYILNQNANFMDKPIRHYKFPDNIVAPFIDEVNSSSLDSKTNSKIYPIGFRIDNDIINAFLDVALDNGLITEEERSLITGYEIFRRDRATERTVIAKGLLYDMYSYKDYSNKDEDPFYYSNYPLNDREPVDILNGSKSLITNNHFYTFHSPETSFYKPTLGTEVYIEGYQFGVGVNTFSPVKNHSEYVLLGRKARVIAGVIAGFEATFEVLPAIYDIAVNATTGEPIGGLAVGIALATASSVSLLISAVQMGGKYNYEWIQTFENFGTPQNLAYYGISEGIYKTFLGNPNTDSLVRGTGILSYMNEGRHIFADRKNLTQKRINHWGRENTVLIDFQPQYNISIPSSYANIEKTRFNYPSDKGGNLYGKINPIASPYVSINRYLPNQYNSINTMSWLPTGYCGDLSKDNNCDIIFGGDIYISRFSVKRKFPFFTSNAIGLAPNVPFKYSLYFNIDVYEPNDRGFLDFKTSDDNIFSGLFILPSNRSEYTLWDGDSWESENINVFYVKDKYKFLLYYYGFPYFLVESEVNCNNRYATFNRNGSFYPYFGDVIDNTQEVDHPLSDIETYNYNSIYSSRPHPTGYRLLPINYSRSVYDKIDNLDNVIISSRKDNNESSIIRSPWISFNAGDFARMSRDNGSLVDFKTIENELLWIRYTDGYEILNAIDNLSDRITNANKNVGIGGMLQSRVLNFNKTDLGYSGTQHRTSISTEFGHYSVDAKRGKVFELKTGGGGVDEISTYKDKWFKEQLPFKILKKYPNLNVDDNYNGIGLAMGWDDRTKRLLLTKLDYIPLNNDVLWDEDNGFHLIDESLCPEGSTLVGCNCETTLFEDKIPVGDLLNVESINSPSYGLAGMVLIPDYDSTGTAMGACIDNTCHLLSNSCTCTGGGCTSTTCNGSAVVNVDYFIPNNNDYWKSNNTFINNNSFVNRNSKWVIGGSLNVWYGFNTNLILEETKTLYVGLAADNNFRFLVDGVPVIEFDPCRITCTVTGYNYDQRPFVRLYVYPITLEAGCHTIRMEAINYLSVGAFCAAIFDNSQQELLDANSDSDLNILFQTSDATQLYSNEVTYICPEGYEPYGLDCGKCYRHENNNICESVSVEDKDYFEPAHWTVGYSPLIKNWISYYSFHPYYYISLNDHFKTGWNDNSQGNLWSHYPLVSSFQVFRGVLYAFIVEFASKTSGINSTIDSINYALDVRKYYNKFDFYNIFGVGFNKAYIYNSIQNSGELSLITQDMDDPRQIIDYPKYNVNNIEVLQTCFENLWSVNYLYNHVRNIRSGLPVWNNDNVDVLKSLNLTAMDYVNDYQDRIRGDYFLIRLVNDLDSRNKMFFRFAIEDRNYYNS